MSRRKRPDGLKLDPTYLRSWREFRKLTLQQAGDAIKLDQGALARIEVGKTPYDQVHLQQLAELYRVTIYELLYKDPIRPSYAEKVAEKLKSLHATPDLKAVETLIDALLANK